MRRLVRLAVVSAIAAGLASPALAKTPGRFVHPADANKDEKVSKAEWLASGESDDGFRAADADRDGFVIGPEFANWFMKKEGIGPFQSSAASKPLSPVNRLVER
jgi:hypothetical protein